MDEIDTAVKMSVNVGRYETSDKSPNMWLHCKTREFPSLIGNDPHSLQHRLRETCTTLVLSCLITDSWVLVLTVNSFGSWQTTRRYSWQPLDVTISLITWIVFCVSICTYKSSTYFRTNKASVPATCPWSWYCLVQVSQSFCNTPPWKAQVSSSPTHLKYLIRPWCTYRSRLRTGSQVPHKTSWVEVVNCRARRGRLYSHGCPPTGEEKFKWSSVWWNGHLSMGRDVLTSR